MRHILFPCHARQSYDGGVVLGDVMLAFLTATIGDDRLGSEAARAHRITYCRLAR